MISTSDKEYQETRLIKQGKAELKEEFRELADWINQRYSVQVMNIYYDTIIVGYEKIPRLNIIFEHEAEELLFREGRFLNFDSERQKEIASMFRTIAGKNHVKPTFFKRLSTVFQDVNSEYENLLVIFTAFEPIAVNEVYESVPKEDVKRLQTILHNDSIWEISTFAPVVTFFFYTDKEAATARQTGYIDLLADIYFPLLKQYDEFNYLHRETFSVTVDSKQNFDENFESSWFYYYR